MSRGADAAQSRSRYVGFTTLLSALCLLGLATSQAVAQGFPQQTEPTTTTVATAPAPPPPAPDPKPAPKPDPKPARPKQIVRPKAPPSPPPPPIERAARRPVATTALSPTAPPKARTTHRRAVPPRRPATSTAVRPPREPRHASAVRAPRDRPSVRRRKAAVPNRSKPAASDPALDLALTSVAASALPKSQGSTKPAIPHVLLLLCLGIVLLGIVLLLGASLASARRGPLPEFAEPLHAHRRDLATAGLGAIALAFLCLNAAVLL